MADLTKTTTDVTIFDNESDNYADVNANNELQTRDNDANTTLTEIEENTKTIHHYQEQGEAFYVTYGATLTSKDTQYDILLTTNPNGSGKRYEVEYLEISPIIVSTGSFVKLRQYASPTITTNGTALTQVNAQIGSGGTSGINIYTLPTISARGSQFYYASSTLSEPFRNEHSLGTALLPNNSCLVTLEATSNGTSVNLVVKYVSYTA